MPMIHSTFRTAIASLGGGAALICAPVAQATDYITLQGVEPSQISHRILGDIGLTYMYNDCDGLAGVAAPNGTPTGNPNAGYGLNNGLQRNPCRVGPKFADDNDGFVVSPLNIRARGHLIQDKINYFVALEAGQNALNYQRFNSDRKHVASLGQASLTFNYVPGARIRVGLMKIPGPEEMLQGIEAADYASPTDFINRQMNELFIKGNARSYAPIAGQGYLGNISDSGYDQSTGRDWGVQVFDAFKQGPWTHTYAVMLGNGNGLHHAYTGNHGRPDVNLYWSSEHDLSGYEPEYLRDLSQNPLKDGVKFYGWYQNGVRNFEIDAAGTESEDFTRERYGIGFKALGYLFGENRGKHRLAMELMQARGMVLLGQSGSVDDPNWAGASGIAAVQMGAGSGNKARGMTFDYGYYFNPKWSIGYRYSRADTMYEVEAPFLASDQRNRVNQDVAVSWRFNPRTRLTLGYTYRDWWAPNAVQPTAASAAAINNAAVQTNNAKIYTSGVGDRITLRLNHRF